MQRSKDAADSILVHKTFPSSQWSSFQTDGSWVSLKGVLYTFFKKEVVLLYFQAEKPAEPLWEECYIFKGYDAHFDTLLFLLLKQNCSQIRSQLQIKYWIFEGTTSAWSCVIMLKEEDRNTVCWNTIRTVDNTYEVRKNPTFTTTFLLKKHCLAQKQPQACKWQQLSWFKWMLGKENCTSLKKTKTCFFKALFAGNVTQHTTS